MRNPFRRRRTAQPDQTTRTAPRPAQPAWDGPTCITNAVSPLLTPGQQARTRTCGDMR